MNQAAVFSTLCTHENARHNWSRTTGTPCRVCVSMCDHTLCSSGTTTTTCTTHSSYGTTILGPQNLLVFLHTGTDALLRNIPPRRDRRYTLRPRRLSATTARSNYSTSSGSATVALSINHKLRAECPCQATLLWRTNVVMTNSPEAGIRHLTAPRHTRCTTYGNFLIVVPVRNSHVSSPMTTAIS